MTRRSVKNLTRKGVKDLTVGSGALGFPAFAKLLGVSRVAVFRADKAGRFSPAAVGTGPNGRRVVLDVTRARREWVENRGQVPKRARAPRGKPAGRSPLDAEGTTLAGAQRLLTLARLEEKRRAIALASGAMIPREEVERTAEEAYRILREGVLNVPARMAGAIAAETDPATVYRLLEEALREALRATARDFRKAAG